MISAASEYAQNKLIRTPISKVILILGHKMAIPCVAGTSGAARHHVLRRPCAQAAPPSTRKVPSCPNSRPALKRTMTSIAIVRIRYSGLQVWIASKARPALPRWKPNRRVCWLEQKTPPPAREAAPRSSDRRNSEPSPNNVVLVDGLLLVRPLSAKPSVLIKLLVATRSSFQYAI